ncbi:DUF6417 family protein [Streptomyces sp. NPDC020597]|uniref:DUF6417 family protein n=2 Tax=Streptomyces TaxID=1883 RepID=UPI00379766B5
MTLALHGPSFGESPRETVVVWAIVLHDRPFVCGAGNIPARRLISCSSFRDLATAADVALVMDGYEHLDLDEIDFAPMPHDVERLRLLTLEETYELLKVLRTVAEDGGTVAWEADRLARELAARIPSES